MFENIAQGPGGADYSTHTWEILLMLLVAFLLGLLLGYLLWYRYKTRVAELEDENARLQSKLSDLEKDHASLRYSHSELDKNNHANLVRIRTLDADNAILAGKLNKLEQELSAGNDVSIVSKGGLDAGTLAGGALGIGAMGAVGAKDDLKKIEGVGPKIEGLLNDGGIHTFAQLANSDLSRLQEILDAAGSRYKMHDPGTWAKQAEFAAAGNWDKLQEYQDYLQGGKDPS